MIPVTPMLSLSEEEIRLEFVRASGPGGQNVNKVATAVQLRFDVGRSPSLPDEVRARLFRLAGRRVTEDGVLLINARRFRTQERNRQDAIDRLVALISKAAERPRARLRTQPAPASRQRRLDAKRCHSKKKQRRRFDPCSEE
jgi:ribosome-associated protein